MNVQHLRVHAAKLLILPEFVLNKFGLVGLKARPSRLGPLASSSMTSIHILTSHDLTHRRAKSGTHCTSAFRLKIQ